MLTVCPKITAKVRMPQGANRRTILTSSVYASSIIVQFLE
jgi:hypothetical protein